MSPGKTKALQLAWCLIPFSNIGISSLNGKMITIYYLRNKPMFKTTTPIETKP